MRRLAICFFSHLRSYKQTYESFFEKVVEVNKKDGWEIDIFIHSWDELSKKGERKAQCDFWKPVTQEIIDELYEIYGAKKVLIEHLDAVRGEVLSAEKVQELARAYEQENNIKYDYTMVVRPDVLFYTPLRLDTYIKWYDNNPSMPFSLPQKHIFSSNYIFLSMPVADPRYLIDSGILWFGNYNPLDFPYNSQISQGTIIPINYIFHKDYFLQRYSFRLCFAETYLNNLLKKTYEENSAYMRVKNSLSYQLGSAMIKNSKSFCGIIKLPYILLWIKIKWHIKQTKYKKTYKKDPSTKLPPLIEYHYPDYVKALKAKEHLSYKLGKSLIEGYKNAWRGGLIKFIISDIPKIKNEFNKKRSTHEANRGGV